MTLGKVDSDKNHIPLENKNESYEGKKKIESRKGERLDNSQEDNEFQRNSKLGQSADDPALIPSNYLTDSLLIEVMIFCGWIQSRNNECG